MKKSRLLWFNCGLADAQKPSIKGTYVSFFNEKHCQDNKLVIKDEIRKNRGLLEYPAVSLALFVPQVACLHYSELTVHLKTKMFPFKLPFHPAHSSCYHICFSKIRRTMRKHFRASQVILSLTMFTSARSVAPSGVRSQSGAGVGTGLPTATRCIAALRFTLIPVWH